MGKNQTEWSRNWNEKHLDRLFVTVPRGRKAQIRAFADKNGETVNGMIQRLIRAEMGLSDEEWKAEENRGE